MARLSVVGQEADNAAARLKERIAAEEDRGLLRFLTCGSVDDGKSTLIGRLLYDSAQVYDDQLKGAERDSKRPGASGVLDLALLVDGLRRSASRRSPSTSPTGISPRPAASSSSPIRRAMCSTPATWPPALPTAISPCCSSTRVTAC
jgi:hypothetical protein